MLARVCPATPDDGVVVGPGGITQPTPPTASEHVINEARWRIVRG